MKTTAKNVIREESGKILILVLVLLVVGGLLLTPLLGLMSTGLVAGQVYEKKAAELYAADAGVEDAIWRIVNKTADFDEDGRYYYPDLQVAEVWVVNDRSVEVEINRERIGRSGPCHVEYGYHILSTAEGDDGSRTRVEAYISALVLVDFSGLLDHVIVSRCDYTLQGGQVNVTPGEGEPHGPVRNYSGYWPTAEILSNWYLDDVVGYEKDLLSIDLNGSDMDLGPAFIDNADDYVLNILNSANTGNAPPPVLELTDTLYITGYTWIGQTGHDFILDLNGNTIFVESSTGAAPESDQCNPGNQYALVIGGKVTIRGSGAIIAIGNIELKPNFDGSEEDYLLVMSVLGKTYMQPVGEFYGTLAGTSEVDLQNSTAEWTEPPEDLNFPMGHDTEKEDALPIDELRIISWEIK